MTALGRVRRDTPQTILADLEAGVTGDPRLIVTFPVQVPANLGGMTKQQAKAALESLGLVYAEGEPFVVNQPELVGTVRAHDPAPNTWLPVGSTVTVRLGVLAEP